MQGIKEQETGIKPAPNASTGSIRTGGFLLQPVRSLESLLRVVFSVQLKEKAVNG